MTDQYDINNLEGYEDEVYSPSSMPVSPSTAREVGGRLSTAVLEDVSGQIQQELVGVGSGDVVNSTIQLIKEDSEASKLEALGHNTVLAPEYSQEELVEAFNTTNKEDDLIDLVNDANIASIGVLTLDEKDSEAFLEKFDRESRLMRELKDEYRQAMSFTGSKVGNAVELVESLVPFLPQKQAVVIEDFIREEFGDVVEAGDKGDAALYTGTYMERLREKINLLDTEDQIEILKGINEKAKESAGILGGNDFLRMQMLDSLFKDSAGEFDLSGWDSTKHIDNAVSLLDATIIGGVVGRAVKGIAAISRGSHIASVTRLSPELGGKGMAKALSDVSDDIAESIGTTKTDIAGETLSARVAEQADIPLVSGDFIKRQQDSIRAVLSRESDTSLMLTDVEKVAQARATEAALERHAGGKLWSNSTVNPVGEGVEIRALYGADDAVGYATKEEAQFMRDKLSRIYKDAEITIVGKRDKSEPSSAPTVSREALEEARKPLLSTKERQALVKELDYLEKKLETASTTPVSAPKSVRISKRQSTTRLSKDEVDGLQAQIESVRVRLNQDKKAVSAVGMNEDRGLPAVSGSVDTPTTQYFVQMSLKDSYKASSNVEFNLDDILVSGSKAKYLGDSSTVFSQHISNAMHVAFDRSRGTEKLMLDMLKPFTKAKNKNKKAIVSLIDKGDKEGKVFSSGDILEMFSEGSDKDMQQIIEGYFSVRNFSDAAYEIHNRTLARHLDEKGLTSALDIDGAPHFVKPLERSSVLDNVWVYDTKSKSVVQLSRDEIERLYSAGGQIVKGERALGDSDRATHIMVRSGDKLATRPHRVLNYREGYVPRMYKEQYFITKRPKSVKIDGDTLEGLSIPSSVITVAKSRKQAVKMAEQLRKEYGDDVVVDWKNDRTLTVQERASVELDYERNTNGLYFGKRGEHIKDVHNSLAETEDPVGSIHRMATSISRHIELTPMMDLMKRRWTNTFGDITNGRFPRSRSVIAHPEKVVDERVEKAKAAWDQIDLIESSGTSNRQWRTAMVRLGEWLEDTTGSEKLGSVVRTKLSERDPYSVVRGSAFTTMIVLNPLRQLFIQSQQVLFLAGLDPKFIFSGQAFRQGSSLALAAMNDVTDIAKYAKAAGMSEKEFSEALSAFKRSGLVESVDSHLVGRDAIKHAQSEVQGSRAGVIGSATKDLATGVLNASKRVGFDFGEQLNLGMTYALARKRYLSKNTSATSPEALYSIQADARQLGLGMTSAGTLGYQHGFLSVATQFLSVQHKAFLAMLPAISKRGNAAISKTEARRIALFQLGLYGASGVGIAAVVNKLLEEAGVVDVSPEAKHFIEGGMYDLLANGLLSSLTEDEVDLAFAKNIAAGQGFTESLTTYIKDILSGDVGLVEIMAGPSHNVASKLGSAYRMSRAVLGSPSALTTEDAKAIANKIGSLASGYNNYLKASAMKNFPNSTLWVDSQLNALPVESNDTEALLAGLFGITGYKQEGFYEYVQDQASVRKELDDIADTYLDRLTYTLGSAPQGDYVALEHTIKLLEHESHFIRAALSSADSEYVINKVQDLIEQRVGKGEQDLVDRIMKASMNNSYGTGIKEIIEGLQRDGLMTKDDGELANKVHDLTYGGDDNEQL